MEAQKVGNLLETIVPKENRVWGDEIDIVRGKARLGVGRIIWIVTTGGALMKVIVEIIRWCGR